jgi:hypothetical protein
MVMNVLLPQSPIRASLCTRFCDNSRDGPTLSGLLRMILCKFRGKNLIRAALASHMFEIEFTKDYQRQ